MADLEVGLHRAHFAHSHHSIVISIVNLLSVLYDHMRLVYIFSLLQSQLDVTAEEISWQ